MRKKREDLVSRGRMNKWELFMPPYSLLSIMQFAKDDNGDPWVPSWRLSLFYVPLVLLTVSIIAELTTHGFSEFQFSGIVVPLAVALAGYYLFTLPLLVWNRRIKI